MSRILIVYDHPYEKSFNHAILQTITAALDAKNRAYDVIALHADGFNPVYGKIVSVPFVGHKGPTCRYFQAAAI